MGVPNGDRIEAGGAVAQVIPTFLSRRLVAYLTDAPAVSRPAAAGLDITGSDPDGSLPSALSRPTRRVSDGMPVLVSRWQQWRHEQLHHGDDLDEDADADADEPPHTRAVLVLPMDADEDPRRTRTPAAVAAALYRRRTCLRAWCVWRWAFQLARCAVKLQAVHRTNTLRAVFRALVAHVPVHQCWQRSMIARGSIVRLRRIIQTWARYTTLVRQRNDLIEDLAPVAALRGWFRRWLAYRRQAMAVRRRVAQWVHTRATKAAQTTIQRWLHWSANRRLQRAWAGMACFPLLFLCVSVN